MGLILTDLIDMCAPVINFNQLNVELIFIETGEVQVIAFNEFRKICGKNKDLKTIPKLLNKKEIVGYNWIDEDIPYLRYSTKVRLLNHE